MNTFIELNFIAFVDNEGNENTSFNWMIAIGEVKEFEKTCELLKTALELANYILLILSINTIFQRC